MPQMVLEERNPALKLYLSGPMTGLPDLNYPAFLTASEHLRALGHEIYNPAEWEERYNKGVFNHTIAFADYCTFISREADGVVVLPGWEKSPGASAEVALALAIKKPVFEYGAAPMKQLDVTIKVSVKKS